MLNSPVTHGSKLSYFSRLYLNEMTKEDQVLKGFMLKSLSQNIYSERDLEKVGS